MGFEKTYHWEKPIHSGVIFGSVLATLISICYYSLISVAAYASLTLLLVVVALKMYVYVMVTFLKKETANPIAQCSQCTWAVPAEKVQSIAATSTEKVNCALTELRRLFLVENMLDSIKFGLSLWLLTYIGSWFNAMTLIILAWVGLFTIPKVYLNNKSQIDPVLEKVKAQYKEVSDKVGAMLPQGKAPAESKKEE
jgi:hypothetical protein